MDDGNGAGAPVDESSLPTTLSGLLRIVREDHAINSEGLWTPGFYALAVHRCGAWASVARMPGPVRRFLLTVHRLAYVGVRNVVGIQLPATVRVGRRVRFAHQHGIVVHDWATIGDDAVVRHGVTLGARSNDPARYRAEAPVVGRRVQLGAGAVVAGAVRVGDDARIGPNVLVLDDVPTGATVLPAAPRVVVRDRADRGPARDGQAPASTA